MNDINEKTYCKRCIMDSSVDGISFDDEGICNYCKLHDLLSKKFPADDNEDRLKSIAEKIKKDGKNKPFDCIAGFSGGQDSTYALYKTVKLGLRPLAVHFDNGWDNSIAKSNIENACRKLDIKLKTITMNWDESKELTNCALRALLPYIDIGDDIGIANSLYSTASNENIKWIIYGHSFRSEGINPLKWNYVDARFARSLINNFSTIKLKQFKNVDIHNLLYWRFVKGIKVLTLPNYYDDTGPEIAEILKGELNWQPISGWHTDNEIFGLQCYYSKIKFGIDWRIVEYSALIRSGRMEREEAFKKLESIPEIEKEEFIELSLKKQDISRDEFKKIIEGPNKFFTDYPNYYSFLKKVKPLVWLLSRINGIPAYSYEKFFNT